MSESATASKAERWLRLFGDIRSGEGRTAFVLMATVFLALLSYYLLKTVREPLVLLTGGAELRSYAAAAQALVLIGVVPAYGRYAARVGRMRLLLGLGLVFMLGLELFFFGALLKLPMLGFFFYVFVGVFSVTLIAHFWSFANDLYAKSAGERLFPLIAVGATCGSVAGSALAKRLFDAGLSAVAIMQLAALFLLLHLLCYVLAFRRPESREQESLATEPLRGESGFRLVLKGEYVGKIAWLLVLLNLVNTTGEYILGQQALSHAEQAAAVALASNASLDVASFIEGYLGSFYGGFYTYVNIASVLLQAFVVSRVVRWTGIGGVLFALPLIALGGYALVALGAGFVVLQWAKTAENATDYSLMNTARAMLWLPTSRDEKYKAKQAVDTFFVRFGDVLSAALVLLATEWIALGPRGLATVNLVLVGLWLVTAAALLRRYRGFDATPPGAARSSSQGEASSVVPLPLQHR